MSLHFDLLERMGVNSRTSIRCDLELIKHIHKDVCVWKNGVFTSNISTMVFRLLQINKPQVFTDLNP